MNQNSCLSNPNVDGWQWSNNGQSISDLNGLLSLAVSSIHHLARSSEPNCYWFLARTEHHLQNYTVNPVVNTLFHTDGFLLLLCIMNQANHKAQHLHPAKKNSSGWWRSHCDILLQQNWHNQLAAGQITIDSKTGIRTFAGTIMYPYGDGSKSTIRTRSWWTSQQRPGVPAVDAQPITFWDTHGTDPSWIVCW